MPAIHIVDPETCNLVRHLAAHRSIGITEAIRVSVEAELAKSGNLPSAATPRTGKSSHRALVTELEAEIRQITLDYTRLRAKAEGKRGIGSRIYQMLARHTAVGALERLVDRPTDGLAFLARIDRLDLAVETIALKPRYRTLFSEETRARARINLASARANVGEAK